MRNIQQLAALKAGLHPPVVGAQVTSLPCPLNVRAAHRPARGPRMTSGRRIRGRFASASATGMSCWTGTCVNSEKRARAPLPRIGRSVMGRKIRIGLLLTAAACLVAVLVDWAVKELNSEATQADIEAEQASIEAEQASIEAEQAIVEAEQAIVEAEQEDTGRAQDATAESHDQG